MAFFNWRWAQKKSEHFCWNSHSTDIFLPDRTIQENIFTKNVHSKWFHVNWKWAARIPCMSPMILRILSRWLLQPQTVHSIITDKVVARWNAFMFNRIFMMNTSG